MHSDNNLNNLITLSKLNLSYCVCTVRHTYRWYKLSRCNGYHGNKHYKTKTSHVELKSCPESCLQPEVQLLKTRKCLIAHDLGSGCLPSMRGVF